MKRRPMDLRQLVPLGGEADSPVDSTLFEPNVTGGSVETQNLQYVPKCMPLALESSNTIAQEELTLDDEEVDQVAQSLIREYLHKKKMGAVLKLFDEISPRQPASISSRAKLRAMLGMGEPHKNFGVLEQVIAQRLVDTQRGHHITLGDAAQNISDMQRGEVKWDASAHFSGSTVSVGGFVIDDSGTKRNSILSPPKIFCDLENNKIIEHFSDLDMTSKVVIGRGASGEVFTVLHRPTGKQVAVKVIKAHEQRQMEEITKELRTLFDNKCSSIVTFHGSFFDSGAIYIALEKMEESLNSAVKTRGLATEEAARACIFQSLLALHHLHTQRKTIHRDIKPANILYNAEGEVKVSDFGVSSGPVASLDGNMASTFIGTLAYMSPERCRGCEYSFASDVWSLGLVLYYLVTGILPFNTQNPIFAIIEADPPDLRKDCPTLSQGALDFFAKCVSKDPEERSSCQDLLEHPWLAGLTLGLVKINMRTWLADTAAKLAQNSMPTSVDVNMQEQAFAALDAALDDL